MADRSYNSKDTKPAGRPTLASRIVKLMSDVAEGRRGIHAEYKSARKFLSILREYKKMPEDAKDKMLTAVKLHRENGKYFREVVIKSEDQIDGLLQERG